MSSSQVPAGGRTDDSSEQDGSRIDRRLRLVLLGGCSLDCLADDLRADFAFRHLWRRPTIPLMSVPVRPAASLGFRDRQARYIERDCAKAHLSELKSVDCDALIFEIVRDVRTPLVGKGGAYLFDPNRMHGLVLDALPASERRIDPRDLLGAGEVSRLEWADEGFFAIWAEHFDRFYATVLAPLIARGTIVIVQKWFLAKRTMPSSENLSESWAYCDAVNALLRRMYAHVARYEAIRAVGIDEDLCLTCIESKWSGPTPTHLAPEVFTLMADQVRSVLDPHDPRIGRSLFDQLMKRAGDYYALIASTDVERHHLNLEILRLRQELACEAARREWEMRRLERRRPLRVLRRACRRVLAALITACSAAPGRAADGRP